MARNAAPIKAETDEKGKGWRVGCVGIRAGCNTVVEVGRSDEGWTRSTSSDMLALCHLCHPGSLCWRAGAGFLRRADEWAQGRLGHLWTLLHQSVHPPIWMNVRCRHYGSRELPCKWISILQFKPGASDCSSFRFDQKTNCTTLA